jgi:hypothetical protein
MASEAWVLPHTLDQIALAPVLTREGGVQPGL